MVFRPQQTDTHGTADIVLAPYLWVSTTTIFAGFDVGTTGIHLQPELLVRSEVRSEDGHQFNLICGTEVLMLFSDAFMNIIVRNDIQEDQEGTMKMAVCVS